MSAIRLLAEAERGYYAEAEGAKGIHYLLRITVIQIVLMNRKIQLIVLAAGMVLAPLAASALEMPPVINMVEQANVTANSYIVVDRISGSVLLEKNASQAWTPASLTKLVTALVFLDTKPNLKKSVVMKASDQTGGGCSSGGACIATKPGISYRLDDLFHASLIASANNATMAVARSTGLSQDEFVRRMNAKAKALGATDTHFVEPTGMSPDNVTTASDYAKVASAAFGNDLIHKIATTPAYSFRATNSKKYSHNVKNTDKLLADGDVTVIGGKTGYLEESQYNFASVLADRYDNRFIVVVFGSRSSSTQFSETKQLTMLGSLAKAFGPVGSVLGTSTVLSLP